MPTSMTHATKRLSSGNDREYCCFLQYRPVKESREKKVVQVPCRIARSRLKATISPSTVRDENIIKGGEGVKGEKDGEGEEGEGDCECNAPVVEQTGIVRCRVGRGNK